MFDLLGYGGLVAALIVTLAIILPVTIISFRQQQRQAKGEEQPAPDSSEAPPPIGVDCPKCGQLNRVPQGAATALCGKCEAKLNVGKPESV